MKELTIQEKAERYDKSLERASNLHKNAVEMGNNMTTKTCEIIFPQLKENRDEKIRKALIDYFDDANKADENPLQSYGVHTDKILAWLEKQGEQKPFDYENVNIRQKDFTSIEPKLKIGDWITDGKALLYVTNFEVDYGYELKGTDGKVFHFVSPDLVEEYYHLWTTNDAKDGDVLAFKDGTSGILLFKESTENFGVLSYCRVIRNSFIDKEESGWGSTLLSPATKEQRDTLMKAMADSGYAFDFEKKELKKIVVPIFNIGDTIVEKDFDECGYGTIKDIKEGQYIFTDGSGMNINEQNGWQLVKTSTNIKQNPAWSEEDSLQLNEAIEAVNESSYSSKRKDVVIDWLKSLKDKLNVVKI